MSDTEQKYKYMKVDSVHRGHKVSALKWGKGKALFHCNNCDEDFYGVSFTIRKWREEDK